MIMEGLDGRVLGMFGGKAVGLLRPVGGMFIRRIREREGRIL